MPTRVLRTLLSRALPGRNVALCLHRVRQVRRGETRLPQMSCPEEEIDALIELLLDSGDRDRRWLTIAFDDGYRDAADYLQARARRYPELEWLFFVCPRKVELEAGFVWDMAERDGKSKLADIDLCRQLAGISNVALGNHTNGHHPAIHLTREGLRREYQDSARDFERLFGPQRHFAFPFGTPGRDLGDEAVELAKEAAPNAVLWSTEARGFDPLERRAGAVLPRFAVDGTWNFRATALWIARRVRWEER
jgi:peptidoglycan/xylan/chitin deacetylase (PgdA/CDA1 family)